VSRWARRRSRRRGGGPGDVTRRCSRVRARRDPRGLTGASPRWRRRAPQRRSRDTLPLTNGRELRPTPAAGSRPSAPLGPGGAGSVRRGVFFAQPPGIGMRVVPNLFPQHVLQRVAHGFVAVAPQCKQGLLLQADPRPAAGAELADGPRAREGVGVAQLAQEALQLRCLVRCPVGGVWDFFGVRVVAPVGRWLHSLYRPRQGGCSTVWRRQRNSRSSTVATRRPDEWSGCGPLRS